MGRLRIDETTRAKLGSEVLADLQVSLWPVDCQTCGGRLRSWQSPALEVTAHDEVAHASLHHPRCRPPAWHERTAAPGNGEEARQPTWRAGAFVLPPGNIPVFLLNPSYESTQLRRSATGAGSEGNGGRSGNGDGWQVASLGPFLDLGFVTRLPSTPLPHLPGLSARLDGERLFVALEREGVVHGRWDGVPVEPGTADVIRAAGWLLVAVVSLLDVSRPFTYEQIRELIGRERTALASVRLDAARWTPAQQRLSRSDFKDAGLPLEVFTMSGVLIGRMYGARLRDEQIAAALALCEGKNWLIRQQRGQDALAVTFLVSSLYALGSHDEDGNPVRRKGVHLIVPNAVRAGEYVSFFAPLVGELGDRVARLGDDPLSEEDGAAMLADVVVGTAAQFAAAHAAYASAGEEWAVHADRGELALVTDQDPADVLSEEFIRRYRKVAVI